MREMDDVELLAGEECRLRQWGKLPKETVWSREDTETQDVTPQEWPRERGRVSAQLRESRDK